MSKRRPSSPTLYILAGPNGAGKTTLAKIFLPEFANCTEFINADYLALGLSPLQPELAAIKAGRMMLERIEELAEQKKTFTVETTLSGKTYINTIKRLRAEGYKIDITFLWLPSHTLAIQRVKQRVRKGGHHIPSDTVKRRFKSGISNLLTHYADIADRWRIFDASHNPPELIVETVSGTERVTNKYKYDTIRKLL